MPRIDDDLKRKLRELKKLEARIRFADGDAGKATALVWDEFFGLRGAGGKAARYPVELLAEMDRAAYKRVIDEYFACVYYRLYQERGIAAAGAYDPDLLSKLGLPMDADADAVKRRFRALAKRYHPDAGGESSKFIEFMEIYRKLVDPAGS